MKTRSTVGIFAVGSALALSVAAGAFAQQSNALPTKPDFAVTEITLCPAAGAVLSNAGIAPGATFTAYVTVRNLSPVTGIVGRVAVWADKPAPALPGDVGDASAAVGRLLPGASIRLPFTLIAPSQAGPGVLRAFADANGATEEMTELNNQLAKPYPVGTVIPKPDFVIAGLALVPPGTPPPSNNVAGSAAVIGGLPPGAPFTAMATVRNVGTATGTVGRLALWLNKPAPAATNEASDVSTNLAALAPGASVQVPFALAAPATAGSYVLRVFADAGAATAEILEDNNQAAVPYQVGAPVPKLDFAVTEIVFSPTPALGAPFTAFVTVKNCSNATGTPGRVAAWLNRPEPVPTNTPSEHSTTVAVLLPGASVRLPFALTAPAAPGAYVFRAFVDADGQTAEANEINNQMVKPYVLAAPVVRKPDFTVADIAFEPAPVSGLPFKAWVTVRNAGQATGTVGRLAVWLNKPAAAVTNEASDASVTVPALKPGASIRVPVPLVAPVVLVSSNNAAGASQPANGFVFRAFVDANNETAEMNEANNQLVRPYRVLPGVPPPPVTLKPDFIITDVSLSPATIYEDDDSFTAYVAVKNQGDAAGNAGYLDVWVGQPAPASNVVVGSGSPTTASDGWALVGALDKDASTNVVITGLVPPYAGNWGFLGIVDSRTNTVEKNENNNGFLKAYTIEASTNAIIFPPFPGGK